MEYRATCEKAIRIDPKIRFATICDMNGRIAHTEHRANITNLLSPDESKRSLLQAVNAWKNRNEFASKIGEGKYALAVYEKVKRITIPLNNELLLYLTTDSDANHEAIIEKALRLKQS
jgi:hypothetical protein